MKDNTLISSGVLNTIWITEHRDLLDLLIPFLKCAISNNTIIGEEVNIDNIHEYFCTQLGYEDIPRNVISVLLNRITPTFLRKKNGSYFLNTSLDSDVVKIEKKRQTNKEHFEKVIQSLTFYLNQHLSKKDLEKIDISNALYDFFSNNGIFFARDARSLSSIKMSDGKVNYEIARFVLQEYKADSSVFSYLVEIVNGFFISTAISSQLPSSINVQSKLRNLNCYLDTRVIIDALGLHLPEAKKCAIELLDMLKASGAKLFCFQHNFDEICDVINAYKSSISNPIAIKSYNTLEAFDEMNYVADDVERYQKLLKNKVLKLGIEVVNLPSYSDSRFDDIIDEHGLETCLRDNVHYNLRSVDTAVQNDVASIAAIMRLRAGFVPEEFEKAKHIFISSNYHYIVYASGFLNQELGKVIPAVMSDTNVAAILWLKNYASYRDFPKHKLIENAMLTLEPTRQFLSTMFDEIDKLEFEGGLSTEEATIIRTDIYCRRQLMTETQGDSSKINANSITAIRDSLKNKYLGDETEKANANLKLYQDEVVERRREKLRALEEIETVGDVIFEKSSKFLRRLVYGIFALIFVAFCYFMVKGISTSNTSTIIMGTFLAAIDIIGLFDLLIGKVNTIERCIMRISSNRAARKMDCKKVEYEKIMGPLQ